MERLTKREGKHTIRIGNEWRRHDPAWDKLAEYEDLELSPNEFKESVDFILELNKKLHNVYDYTEIAKKLWTYICIIDDEKATYEELADAIGLTDDEIVYCRRLER